MESAEFTRLALVTESRPEALNFNRAGLLRLLQALTLSTEIADQTKKTMFYGKTLDIDSFAARCREASDRFATLAQLAPRLSRPEDSPTPLNAPNMRILHGGIGIYGESGEILEALIKQIETGELDLVNVGEESGDVDWYQAIIADESGVSIAQADVGVIAKLKKRYGDKFSAAAALNRDLAGERAVLEANLSAANDDGSIQKAA